MNRIHVTAVGILAIGIVLAACGQASTEAVNDPPAVVEAVEGSELSRITLTARAAERLAIETAAVEDGPGGTLTVPYGAVFYDSNGEAWTYTNPEELVYVRAPIVIDEIDGEVAVLSEGPEPGTNVVTIGAAELYGTESGIGGGGH
jgi:hypothetical protein